MMAKFVIVNVTADNFVPTEYRDLYVYLIVIYSFMTSFFKC